MTSVLSMATHGKKVKLKIEKETLLEKTIINN